MDIFNIIKALGRLRDSRPTLIWRFDVSKLLSEKPVWNASSLAGKADLAMFLAKLLERRITTGSFLTLWGGA